MEKEIEFSLVIPNWNGQKLLEKNLPKILAAVKEKTEIIVVDDASTDQSVEFLRQNFPSVKIITHEKNLGFGAACNTGMKNASGELVVLLNSDVIPHKDFLNSVLPHFRDQKVFAVTFNEGTLGPGKLIWKEGFLEIEATSLPREISLTGWPNGGTSIFRKETWFSLNGLDPLFLPFYFEDIDLGIRAYKLGYKCFFEPKSRVEHKHESTINKSNFRQEYIDFIKQRNHLLLTWKNLDKPSLFLSHLSNLFKKCLLHPRYLKVGFFALYKFTFFSSRKLKGKYFSTQKVLAINSQIAKK